MRGQELVSGQGYLVRVVHPAAAEADIHTLDLTLSGILSKINHGERES